MTYPDGKQVSLGDHIWWNEGSSIGFVHVIVETLEEQAQWGFDEPHILLSGFHPANPEGPGYVAYPLSEFENEGIGVLTAKEEEDFSEALESAKTTSGFVEPFQVHFEALACEWVFEELRDSRLHEFARITTRERGTL